MLRPSRHYSEGSFFWRESKRWRYIGTKFRALVQVHLRRSDGILEAISGGSSLISYGRLLGQAFTFLSYLRLAKVLRTLFLIRVNSLPKQQLADLAYASLFSKPHFLERLFQLRINPNS